MVLGTILDICGKLYVPEKDGPKFRRLCENVSSKSESGLMSIIYIPVSRQT